MFRQLNTVLWLLTALALSACNQNETSVADAQAVRVATVSVAADTGYRVESSYTGRVEAGLSSALGFEVGGLLESVVADEGTVVAAGDLLAELDTARLAAQRAEAAAAWRQTQAELELARATLARTEEAFEYKGVSRQQLDEAVKESARLEAAAAVFEARLDRIEVDLDKAALRAPFAGVVVQRLADPGVVLAPGEPLIALESQSLPEVRIGISPEAAQGLVIGETYALTVNNRDVPAVLRTIVPRRDEASRTVDSIFEIGNGEADIRPGDLARLDTERRIEQPGFWVPVSALVEGPRGLWQVLVAEGGADEHVLVKHTLEVLHADAELAYVRGTLAEGDLLVSRGTHRVVAGQRVVVMDDAQLASAGDDQ